VLSTSGHGVALGSAGGLLAVLSVLDDVAPVPSVAPEPSVAPRAFSVEAVAVNLGAEQFWNAKTRAAAGTNTMSVLN